MHACRATWWWTGSTIVTGDIPPGKEAYFNSAECAVQLHPGCDSINAFANTPHAHFLGSAVWTEHYCPDKYGQLTYVRAPQLHADGYPGAWFVSDALFLVVPCLRCTTYFSAAISCCGAISNHCCSHRALSTTVTVTVYCCRCLYVHSCTPLLRCLTRFSSALIVYMASF